MFQDSRIVKSNYIPETDNFRDSLSVKREQLPISFNVEAKEDTFMKEISEAIDKGYETLDKSTVIKVVKKILRELEEKEIE